VLALLALVAGCGSAAPAARGPAAEAPPGGGPFLATSQGTAAGSWAIAVMGGSVAAHNNFWQLFVRPAGSSRWKLATPPGVADNGGLVVAGLGGRSLVTAFRPSQYLTYTPLALTRDGGRSWSPAGPLDAPLANSPGALAAAPRTRHLLALLADGTAKVASGPGYTHWATLTTRRALAATPAGRRCGLHGLTAATFAPSGTPLLAGTCSRPGTAGIFASRGGTWQPAGPALRGVLARQHITVLAMTATARGTAALLSAGAGPTASVLAVWRAGDGAGWALSPSFPLRGSHLHSASFTSRGAALVLTGGRGETITGPGGSWQPLPALPRWTQTLAPTADGQVDALAAHGTLLTVWRHGSAVKAWATAQVLHVPVQYGSSG
jgi:hypothetical protein